MVITVTLGDIIFYVFMITIILCGLGLVLVNKIVEIRNNIRKKKREKELEKMRLSRKEIENHYDNAVAAGKMGGES